MFKNVFWQANQKLSICILVSVEKNDPVADTILKWHPVEDKILEKKIRKNCSSGYRVIVLNLKKLEKYYLKKKNCRKLKNIAYESLKKTYFLCKNLSVLAQAV